MRIRWDTDTVRASFAKEGYVLPENWEYVNNITKIPYVCSEGHKHSIRLIGWKKGRLCPLCDNKHKTEKVRASFAKEGYVIPENWEYVNNITKIPYVCSEGHKHSITCNSWQSGKRCKYCSKQSPVSSEQVRESFAKEGYVIPEDWEYVNNNTKIPYECPKGHKHRMSWTNWRRCSRCKICNYNVTSNLIRELFSKEGYIIPANWGYIGVYTKIPYECPRGHEHSIAWNNWKSGRRCVWCGRAEANLKKYNPNEFITLYWIKIHGWINDKWCYKFGETKNTVKIRFTESLKTERFRIKEIDQTRKIASEICYLEQDLLYRIQEYRAKWVPSYFGGSTECFECTEQQALDIWNDVVNGW